MSKRVEWKTLGLILLTYGVWALATVWLAGIWLPLAVIVTALSMALHSSLSHEVLHGHPTQNQWLNEALVFPAIGLFIPYIRFRDTHLEHHIDDNLTDPYDDPESNYLDPAVWAQLSPIMRALLRVNNTLLGRLLIGPVVAQVNFRARIGVLSGRDNAVWRRRGFGISLGLSLWPCGWPMSHRCRFGPMFWRPISASRSSKSAPFWSTAPLSRSRGAPW